MAMTVITAAMTAAMPMPIPPMPRPPRPMTAITAPIAATRVYSDGYGYGGPAPQAPAYGYYGYQRYSDWR